uniref:GFA family protein n=1 Tax=Ferrimonas sediminicola TaxID=2569538 RepID=UPI001E4A3C12|nr:GFA family protein [Ferrimonas sediminicola]
MDCPVEQVYLCHCSICRRATGANGIAVVVVDNAAFRWLRGEQAIATWRKPGADWQMGFCSTCGSPLPGENDATTTYIPAGLFDTGAESLRVAHHIWVDSMAAWDEIGDGGQRHPEAFGSG